MITLSFTTRQDLIGVVTTEADFESFENLPDRYTHHYTFDRKRTPYLTHIMIDKDVNYDLLDELKGLKNSTDGILQKVYTLLHTKIENALIKKCSVVSKGLFFLINSGSILSVAPFYSCNMFSVERDKDRTLGNNYRSFHDVGTIAEKLKEDITMSFQGRNFYFAHDSKNF